MYDKSADIPALISSRICHDLISPLGAIRNGLELLELSGISRSPELALFNECIETANARIQFFRIAYGSDSGDFKDDSGFVQGVLADYFTGKRVQVHWMLASTLPRHLGKLLFLLIQCAESALPYGGRISVKNAGETWIVEASGRIKHAEPVWQLLQSNGSTDDLQPSEVQFELARSLAHRNSLHIKVLPGDTKLTIEIS